MKRTYEEIKNEIIELLENDDDIFCECVNELDSYNGFADGFRCYDMSELDDFYSGSTVSKFLEDLTEDFCKNDEYFYFSIYGLESCDDEEELYRENVDIDDMIDKLLDNSCHLCLDNELQDLLDELEAANLDEEESEEE